jgi:hypothetical protein
VVIDLIQSIFNLILGLFVLRFAQLKLHDKAPDSEFDKALAYLLH